MANTEASRAFLSSVIKDYNVTSVFDAGCGDVNWQRLVDGLDRVRYDALSWTKLAIDGCIYPLNR